MSRSSRSKSRAARRSARKSTRKARRPAGTRTIRESSTTVERSSSGGGALLAALVVGVGAYWWMNRDNNASAAGLQAPPPGSPQVPVAHETGTGGPGGGGSGGGAGGNTGALSRQPNAQGQSAPAPQLVSRLTSDSNARLIFAFQSLGFSTGLTEAVPDGIMGPKTTQLIAAVNRETNASPPITTIDQRAVQLLSRLARFRATTSTNPFPLRLQQVWLPEATVVAVNRLAIGYQPPPNTTTQAPTPLQTFYGPTG